MISLGTHGQGCLDGGDYAAVALAMQANRDAVDAALTADRDALNVYNNRPWWQATTTVTATAAQTGTEWTFGTSWNGFTITQSNTSSNTVVSSGVPNFTAGNFTTGWWNVGGYCSYQPTGAVTNFSRRLLALQVSHAVQLNNVFDTIVQTSFESNTGTDSMTIDGVFYLDNQYTYTFVLGFSHRNAGSTVQVNTGARIWANYLASGEVI